MNPATRGTLLDPDLALACVHCGLCLSACPTYLETGNENDSPRGRIHLMRALEAGRLPLNPTTVRHLDLCLGCRACEVACPSGVRYGALLESTRDTLERTHRRRPLDAFLRRWIIPQLFPYPNRLRWALLPARALRAAHLQHLLPRRLRDLFNLLPAPGESASDRIGPIESLHPAPPGLRRGKAGLVTGCVMQVLFPDTHRNTIRLLNAAGYDVVVPASQGCCGALHAHGGHLDAARRAARHNLEAFRDRDLDVVVVNAAGCGSTLKEYGHLLAGDPAEARAAAAFAARVRDLTEVLAGSEVFMQRLARIAPASASLGRVTCQDACHLAHAQGVTREPRRLLGAVAGEAFVEMPESDVCCGSAGSYNLTEPDMARRLQERKLRNVQSLGDVTIVTTNPGCLLQIRAGLQSAGLPPTRAVHIADWLAGVLPLGASQSHEHPAGVPSAPGQPFPPS